MLDAFQGKSRPAAEAAAAAAAAATAASATEREDGLPVEGAVLIRLWYTLEQLQSILGARASFIAAVDQPQEADSLVSFTLALSGATSRRVLRREIIPQWREQWAKKGTECESYAPMPPSLSALPTDTIQGAWPTKAIKAATQPALRVPASAPNTALEAFESAKRAVRVLLVTGMPGPAVEDACAGAINLTSGSFAWLPSPDGSSWCDGTGGFDTQALTSMLSSIVKASAGSSPKLPEQLLISTHGIPNDLPSLVVAVATACSAASAAASACQIQLSAVVTCIDAPRALEQWSSNADVRRSPQLVVPHLSWLCPPSRCASVHTRPCCSHVESRPTWCLFVPCSLQVGFAPGVLECLDDGFVQSIVICCASELQSGDDKALYDLIANVSPSATIIRAPRSAGVELGSFLGGSASLLPFYAPAMASARAVSSPLWAARLDTLSSGALQAGALLSPPSMSLNPALSGVGFVKLPPPPPLDSELLRAKLRELVVVPPQGESARPHLMLMWGSITALEPEETEGEVVALSDGPGAPMRLDVDVSAKAFRKYLTAPIDGSAPPAEGLSVVYRGMSRRELVEMLLACRRLPPTLPRVVRGSITPARLEMLRAELANGPLPDDTFFDGRNYVEMDGSKSEEHPDFEAAVGALLDELNAEVDASNQVAKSAAAKAQIEAEEYLRRIGA